MLTLAALVLSWGASVLDVLLGTVTLDPVSGASYIFVPADLRPVFILRALSTVSFLLAGLIAMVRGEYRRLTPLLRAACWGTALLSGIWLAIGYDTPTFRRIFLAPTSPLIWLMPLGLFAGMRRELWPNLDPVIRLLAYATTALGLVSFFTIDVEHYGRFIGISPLIIYTNWLFWFGSFLLLKREEPGRLSPFRLAPLMVCLLLALFTQSRGWALLCLLVMGLRIFGVTDSNRSGYHRKNPILWQVSWFVLLLAAAGWFLAAKLSPALIGLKERLTEDSRTGEYAIFFSATRAEDLILGKGPEATYDRNGEPSQFLDNQFLWILFIAGLPALVCYCSLIVWPAVRPFVLRQPSRQSVLGIILIFWALAMIGVSTFFNISTSVENLFIILIAGRCHDAWASTPAYQVYTQRHHR